MTGNRKVGAVVQARDLALFRELGTLRVVDREMASVAAGFQSITRVNERLLKLTRGGLLKRFFAPSDKGGMKALYALTAKGAALVDATAADFSLAAKGRISRSAFLDHQMQVNEIYLQAKFRPCPEGVRFLRWISFRKSLAPSIPLVPDGYLEIQTPEGIRSQFIEIDLGTESSKAIAAKAEKYLQLAITGKFSEIFKRSRFQVLLITSGPKRLASVKQAVAKVTEKIFWLSTFDAVTDKGLWSDVWQRPNSSQQISLL
jgi:hypothetical protein